MKKCFLCVKEKSVLEFNDKTFEKCVSILLFRRSKNFKYGEISLTQESKKTLGYHTPCFKKVCVLKNKYKEEFNDFYKTQAAQNHGPDKRDRGEESSTSLFSLDGGQKSTRQMSDNTMTTIESTKPNNESELQSTSLRTTHLSPHSSRLAIGSDSSFTNVNKKSCIFCECIQKKTGKRKSFVMFPQSEETVNKIKEMAKEKEDARILATLNTSETIAYHMNCLSAYRLAAKRSIEECSKTSSWHKNIHKSAFESLSAFIVSEIISKNKVVFLADLLSRYKALLLELGEDQIDADDFQKYRIEHLESKIMNEFGDQITIETSLAKHGKKIVYLQNLDISVLATEAAIANEKDANRKDEVAYELRQVVKSIKKRKMPDNLTANDIIRGECDIPEELFEFMCNLIQGPDIRRKESDDDYVKIKSLCSDIIYIITKGRRIFRGFQST